MFISGSKPPSAFILRIILPPRCAGTDLGDTVYGEALRGLDHGDTEKVMEDYAHTRLIKGLRYYNDPAAIMICYMLLAEYEVRNIVRIVEGVRYGVEPEEIRRSLTGLGKKE